MRKEKPEFEIRAIATSDGFELIKRPRRKKPKYQKLDDNNLIEAEIIRRREDALIKRLRALDR